MADAGNVQVAAGVDPASLATLTNALSAAITGGFEKGFGELKGMFAQLSAGPLKQLGEQMSKTFTGKTGDIDKTEKAIKDLGGTLTLSAKDSLVFVTAYKQVSESLTGLTAIVNKQSSEMKSAVTAQNTTAIAGSNERVAVLRNEGKIAQAEVRAQGDIALRETKTAGQQRVQITRSILDTIGRLEKGLGATLSGIARTSVGAVSKVFDGLKGIVSRSDREVFNSSSLTTSLKERERELQSSFSRQTNTIRESVTRQESALISLRETTQKGVLGQVSNATLLGGLGVGFAALAGLKSVFTIGSDFTRGLAVLQASLDLTDSQMKKVRETSINLGNDLSLPGVSALDAAQAIQTLTKQFGSLGPAAVEAAEAAAKGTLQLARASRASGDDAAALIGSAVNVFKVNASDAVFAADAITGALTRAAGVGFADFKDSFVQGATVFEQFVGPAENAKDTLLDFNTTLAILAKNGITGSNAGAGLKQFFIQATQNTKSAANASHDLTVRAGEAGSVFFDSAGKARKFSDSVEILRKGVVGLTDETRNQVLGDLFGSRSITVANALINSTGVSFKQLRDQIAQEGIAAKIAAAQNAGWAGALDALGSVIDTAKIKLFELVNGPLRDATLEVAIFVDKVLNGATPAMHELRIALLGVAAGIGALIALKTGVEVLALLGKTAALIFTPVGALVTVFALLGGGLALFADKNKDFGAQLIHVKDAVVGFGQDIVAKVQPAIQTVSNFIQQTAIPTIQRWAGIVARDLKGAFEATVRFIQDTVIPGVRSFVSVLTTEVFPKIASVAQIVVNAVITAKNAVVGFATDVAAVVGPLIAPAVKGFQDLGSAIAGFFTGGGLSQLGSGFASAGAGIGSAFANIGVTVFNALKPVGVTVLAFFKDLFSVHNLITAVDAIGDFLNFVGEKLAQIVTNPKVIAAIGIVGAIAAKLAFDLVTGLAQGILDNIPQLLKDAGSLIVDNLFKPDVILAAIAAFFVGLNIVAPIVKAFRSAGEQGATGLAEGFKSKLGGTGDFFSGLLGRTSDSQALLGGLQKEAQGLQNQLRILGSTSIIGPSQISEAKKEIGQLSDGLSDAQLAGLKLRDSLRTAFTTIGDVIGGGGQVLAGLAQIPVVFGKAGALAVQAFRENARFSNTGSAAFAIDGKGVATDLGTIGTSAGKTFGQSLRDGLIAARDTVKGGFQQIGAALSTAAAEQGTTVGKAISQNIGKALAGATAGVLFGQQLGSKDGTSQLLGLGGLAASAIAIGGPLGIATAGVGLLTAAFTRSHDEAAAYKADIDKIAQELDPKLTDAVKAGKLSIEDLRNGLTFGDVDKAGISNSVKSIVDSLSSGSLKTLQDFGKISFADSFKGIIDSGVPVKQVASDIRASLLDLVSSSDEFKQKFGSNADDIADLIKRITAPGGPGSLQDAIDKNTFDPGSFKIPSSVTNDNKAAIESIISLFNDTGAAVDKNAKGLEAATDKAIAYGHAIAGIDPAGILAIASTGVVKAIVDSGDALDKSSIAIERAGSAFKNVVPPATVNRLSGVKIALQGISDKFKTGVIPAGTVSGATPAEDVAAALQNILDIKANINAAFAEGILPPGVTSSQDALDQGILAVSGVGEALKKSVADNLAGTISEAVKNAQIDATLKSVGEAAGKVIQQGVNDNVIIDDATATAAIAPLKKEILDTLGADNPLLAAQIEATFGNIVATVHTAIDSTQAAKAAQAAAEAAQAALTPLTLPVTAGDAKLPPHWGIDAQALAASVIASTAPISFPAPVLPDVVVPASFDDAAILAARAGGTSIGGAVASGMSSGIAGGKSGVVNAATQIARDAINAARVALSISSPSKVFRQIGLFITKGLSQGIDTGADEVVNSITDLVANAVDAATGAASSASKALRAGGSGLFAALFGSGSIGSRSSFSSLQGQITQSFSSLGSALDDSFNRAADVLTRSATEALNRSDLDVLGEAANSLNVNDVLGSSNRAALASTLDSIVALGQAMIDTGAPASQVTDTLQGYIDHVRALAVQYGLSSDDVDGLVNELGLGSDALADFVRTTSRLSDSLGHTTTSAKALNSTVVDLFKNLTAGGDAFKTLTGVGAAEDARAKVTSGLSTIAAAADANDQRAKGILDAIAAGNALSLADQLAFNQGLNGRQINFSDQFGIANRAAFEDAIGGIRDLGEALLAGGSTFDYVHQQIDAQITALVAYGTSLGFNADQIFNLIDTAGLGGASLNAFTQSVADAQAVADQATAAQNALNDSRVDTLPLPGDFPAGSNPFNPVDPNATTTPTTQITVIQNLPYADPGAIALAAANGVASAVRLPV